ncbi:MAG: hypothetical protein AAF772_16290, partial [Acidobacteriota bacterium]
RDWQQGSEAEGTPVPRLVRHFYRGAPHRIQEFFDGRMQSMGKPPTSAAKEDREAYVALQRNAQNVVATFKPNKESEQTVGFHLIRSLEAFVTTAHASLDPAFELRHLARLYDADDALYVAAIGARQIGLWRLHTQAKKGDASLESSGSASLASASPPLRGVQWTLSLHRTGQPSVLVMGTRERRLALWAPLGTSPEGAGDDAVVSAFWSRELDGALVGAAPVPDRPSELIVLCVADVVQLVHFRISGSRLREIARWRTALTWADAITVVHHVGRTIFAVAQDHDVVLLDPARDTDPQSDALIEFGRRTFDSPVRALSAQASQGSRDAQLYIGVRDGHVYRLDLIANALAWRRIRWIYCMHHGVAALEAMPGTRGDVGVRSVVGELVVLTEDGQPFYQYRPVDPAKAATFLIPRGDSEVDRVRDYVVLGFDVNPGRFMVQERVVRPADWRKQADAVLARVDVGTGSDPKLRRNETSELAWTLACMAEGHAPKKIHETIDFRLARRLLIRHIARTYDGDDHASIVNMLRLVDLARLLDRLRHASPPRNDVARWMRSAVNRLIALKEPQTLDASVRHDASRVLYQVVQWDRSRQDDPLLGRDESLLRLPAGLYDNAWFALLIAQVIIDQVTHANAFDTATQSPETMDRTLLDALLPALSGLPVAVLRAAAVIVGGSHRTRSTHEVLLALHQVANAATLHGELATPLDELDRALEPWRTAARPMPPNRMALFAAHVACLADRGEDVAAWRTMRAHLQDVRRLVRKLDERLGADAFDRYLLQPADDYVPAELPDLEPPPALREQHAWFDEADQWLHQQNLKAKDEHARWQREEQMPAWGAWTQAFHRAGRARLRVLLKSAQEALRERVWLGFEPLAVREESGRSIVIRLRIAPQSFRLIDDVHYTLDGSGTGGLLEATDGRHLLRVPGRWDSVEESAPAHVVELRGRRRINQEEVRVRCALTVDDQRARMFTRTIALPRAVATDHSTSAPYPHALPTAFDVVRTSLARRTRDAVVVLLDDALGRDALVQAIADIPRTRAIHLDATASQWGPDRMYPRRLTLTNVLGVVRNGRAADDEHDLGDVERVVITEADETLERLLTHRSLRAELDSLRRWLRGRSGRKPAVILVVAAHLGRRLVGSGAVERWPAHRLIGALARDAVLDEAAAWLAQPRVVDARTREAVQRQARSTLRQLGGDLRLTAILRARHQALADDAKGRSFRAAGLDVLLAREDALAVMQSELEGLPPRAIFLLMVAAASTVQLTFGELQAGHVLAEPVYSAVGAKGGALKFSSRPIFATDDVLREEDIISKVRADRRAKQRWTQVRGLQLGGGVTVLEPLRELAKLLRDERVLNEATAELEARDLVRMVHGTVYTVAPYGPLIRAALRAGRDSSAIFRDLTGRDSLFEGLSLVEIDRLDDAGLRTLAPALAPERRQRLGQ